MRTTGKGVSHWSSPPGCGPATGRTVTVSKATADAPPASVARTATTGAPGELKVVVADGPVASPNWPSPLRSQLSLTGPPSGSLELAVRVTRSPTWTGFGDTEEIRVLGGWFGVTTTWCFATVTSRVTVLTIPCESLTWRPTVCLPSASFACAVEAEPSSYAPSPFRSQCCSTIWPSG